MANLSLNPMATTNALGSFGVQSDGYVQGIALDDPANRFNLAAGTVAATKPNLCGAVCRWLNFCQARILVRAVHKSATLRQSPSWKASPCSIRRTMA